MKILQPNIARRGRVARALGGLALAGAALALQSQAPIAAFAAIVVSAFLFFEAGFGWCAARACGLKTPL